MRKITRRGFLKNAAFGAYWIMFPEFSDTHGPGLGSKDYTDFIDIDLTKKELVLYRIGFKKVYRIGIGKMRKGVSKTPTGNFFITSITKNPAWYPPVMSDWVSEAAKEYYRRNGEISYGHPLNPFRGYWFGLRDGYGIHGTNKPESIKKAMSNGCVRMLGEDIADLRRYVYEWMPVKIHN